MSEAEAAAAETSEPTPMEGADGEQKEEPLNEVRWVARSGLLKNGLGLGLVWLTCGVGGVGGGSRAAASRA